MQDTPRNEERAALYLRCPLEVTRVERRSFPAGPAAHDEIITTNRFILVLRGKLAYTIGDTSWTMPAGTQFLVPAWVRRVWTVPRGSTCETIWCEFDEGATQSIWHECVQRKMGTNELRREKLHYQKLLRIYREQPIGEKSWNQLRLEAELKVMLVRFLEFAETPAGTPPRTRQARALHPGVKLALRWASGHFCEPGVLDRLYLESGMSRNHFRILFGKAVQCSPQVYIERMRLRHARILLHGTNWQLKRIAAEIGYEDPLYFSRLYRRFWKHAPSAERLSKNNSGPRSAPPGNRPPSSFSS